MTDQSGKEDQWMTLEARASQDMGRVSQTIEDEGEVSSSSESENGLEVKNIKFGNTLGKAKGLKLLSDKGLTRTFT